MIDPYVCLVCGYYRDTPMHEMGCEMGSHPRNVAPPTGRPTVVTLCGSVRFWKEFQEAYGRESLAGRIVLTIGCTEPSKCGNHHSEDEKKMLDELHKRKIDISDEILVLNVGGYFGDSTMSEIQYAKARGKRIRWLES